MKSLKSILFGIKDKKVKVENPHKKARQEHLAQAKAFRSLANKKDVGGAYYRDLYSKKADHHEAQAKYHKIMSNKTDK